MYVVIRQYSQYDIYICEFCHLYWLTPMSVELYLKVEPCKLKMHWYMIAYLFQKYPKNLALQLFIIFQ